MSQNKVPTWKIIINVLLSYFLFNLSFNIINFLISAIISIFNSRFLEKTFGFAGIFLGILCASSLLDSFSSKFLSDTKAEAQSAFTVGILLVVFNALNVIHFFLFQEGDLFSFIFLILFGLYYIKDNR